MAQALGYVLYEGPSLITGNPITTIATGFAKPSTNQKTGDMIQTWILSAGTSPDKAISDGTDRDICGACPHRGDGASKDRTCYVNIKRAPLSVWQAYKRNRYPKLTDHSVFGNRLVRLGAYGDPAAVPISIWKPILHNSAGHTGYTHQWRTCDRAYSEFLMASADTVAERFAAKALGYRVFRVRAPGSTDKLAGEVVCPASAEAGFKLNCATCLACHGTNNGRRGDIVISAHGAASLINAYKRRFPDDPQVKVA